MKELDVVVDVRPSEDTDELIVLKQKVSFNGEVDLVGDPVETRVRFANRKAQVTLFGYADNYISISLAAKVKNVGIAPFVVSRVALVFEYEQPRDQTTKGGLVMKDVGGSIDMLPKDQGKPGPLLAGEVRDYFLPQELFDGAALIMSGLSPSRYRVAAFCGDEEVGRVGGEHIRSFLGNVKIKFHRRALPLFDTLPEPSRLAVIKAVAPLRNLEPKDWPAAGAKPLGHGRDTFVLDAGDNLLVLLAPFEGKRVQISDIVNKHSLDQFNGADEGVKQSCSRNWPSVTISA